jgi:hypothetical protein
LLFTVYSFQKKVFYCFLRRSYDRNAFRHVTVNVGFSVTYANSPCATVFITVLFLPPLTEHLQYQLVMKDEAVPGRAEAALNRISPSPPDATTHHRAIRANTPQPRYSRVYVA